jgi:hypothetical protein
VAAPKSPYPPHCSLQATGIGAPSVGEGADRPGDATSRYLFTNKRNICDQCQLNKYRTAATLLMGHIKIALYNRVTGCCLRPDCNFWIAFSCWNVVCGSRRFLLLWLNAVTSRGIQTHISYIFATMLVRRRTFPKHCCLEKMVGRSSFRGLLSPSSPFAQLTTTPWISPTYPGDRTSIG